MLKVFLVEDEIVVREGIKNNMNWQDNGFQFCGEASDGELAYPMIQKLKPDIVITDIRMPFMDGLELSRLIKKELPNLKIIILSGYGEFEYAKEAIQIGVAEYLLKPINSADLMASLKKVRDEIYKEREEKANLEKYMGEMAENTLIERRKLFQDMISPNLSISSIMERGKELNIELSALWYQIVLFTMTVPRAGKNVAKHNQHGKAIETIQVILEDKLSQQEQILKFDCFMDDIAFVIKGDSQEEIAASQQYLIDLIKDILEDNTPYFGGIGVPVNRISELYHSYHEASRAFAYRYLWDQSDFVDSRSLGKEINLSNRKHLDMSSVTQIDKKKADLFLRSGSKEEIPFFVEEYLHSVGGDKHDSVLFRQYLLFDVYYQVAALTEELGGQVEEHLETIQDVSRLNYIISSYDMIRQYIQNMMEQGMSVRDEITSRQYTDMINQAKEYIHQNYSREDISLNTVATCVYLSPSHFSVVFRQKTGQTFIKYLTDYRMNKAKELLRCTEMRSSDIGYAVGYKDPHYFSYLFKKTQHCTPKQFRAQKELKV